MKVLQINMVCGIGSTGNKALQINENLKINGYEGIIAYGVGDSSYRYSYKIGGKINYYYHNIMSRIFGHEGFYSYFITRRFLKFVDGYKPDIIHLRNLHGHYINIKLLFNYIKKNDIATIWTLHDCWAFTGKCAHFEMSNCYKWHNMCYKCPELATYPSSILDVSKNDYKAKKELFVNIKNLTIITPSEWLYKHVKKSFLKKHPSKIINNGINIEVFKPCKIQDDELINKLKDKFVVLGVSNPWRKRKGYDDFIALAKHFSKNNNIKFVMVGIKENSIKIISSNIISIKTTNNREKLARIYSRADVFVNPTYEDNFPTVNIEALACGTPVVTYDTGGSAEIIDNKTGIAVNKGDIKKLISALKEVKDKGKAYYMQSCRNRAESFFNSNKQNDKYIKVYFEILEDKSVE